MINLTLLLFSVWMLWTVYEYRRGTALRAVVLVIPPITAALGLAIALAWIAGGYG